eukprot:GSA120T00008665001.1
MQVGGRFISSPSTSSSRGGLSSCAGGSKKIPTRSSLTQAWSENRQRDTSGRTSCGSSPLTSSCACGLVCSGDDIDSPKSWTGTPCPKEMNSLSGSATPVHGSCTGEKVDLPACPLKISSVRKAGSGEPAAGSVSAATSHGATGNSNPVLAASGPVSGSGSTPCQSTGNARSSSFINYPPCYDV